MKFFIALVLTALFSFLTGLWLDWWCIAVIALLVAVFIHQKAGKAFLSGFLALFLLWGCLASWISIKNESLLATRLAEVFGIGAHPTLMVLITALIGALVAGFAAMTGSYLRSRPKS